MDGLSVSAQITKIPVILSNHVGNEDRRSLGHHLSATSTEIQSSRCKACRATIPSWSWEEYHAWYFRYVTPLRVNDFSTVKRLPLSTGETQRTQRRRRGIFKAWSIILCFGFSISVTAQTSEWRYYGGDSGGQRYSELKQINTDNVTSLKRAWTYHTGELELGLSTSPFQASFSCTPIVVKGVMYVSTPSSRVIALDAETGTELWRFDPQADKRVREFNSHRGVAYWEDKLGRDRRSQRSNPD